MQAVFEIDRENDSNFEIFEAKNNNVAPHFHSNLEIVYVKDGEITIAINGTARELTAGDVAVISNYAIHSYHSRKESEIIVLILPLDKVKSLSTIIDKKTFTTPFLQSAPCSKEIFHCFTEIQKIRHTENDLRLKGYSYVILSLLIDNLGLTDIKDLSSSFFPREILIYMQQNFLGNITLSDIALKFGYSKYYFSRFFNAHFNCGFKAYLNTLRSRQAAKMLSETKMNMTDICYNSGFDNQRTFNRAFYNVFGVTPSEYRKQRYKF